MAGIPDVLVLQDCNDFFARGFHIYFWKLYVKPRGVIILKYIEQSV